MKNVSVSVRVACVLGAAFAAFALNACGGDDETKSDSNTNNNGNGDGDGKSEPALPGALDTYAWEDPAANGDVKTNPKAVELRAKDKDQNESVFACTEYDHDTNKSYDKIVWLAEETGPVKPGMILQGKAFKQGQLSPLPVRRTPIKISVNLAIPTPTRTIESPDTASIQEAISKFQQEADQLADVPGTIERTVEEVTTKEQIALSLDVHASYSGLLASAKMDTNISHEMGLTQHTVVARLVQPMYTVTFADEAIPNAREFFAKDLTDADWKAAAEAGTISTENQPVFISSVTYGRMVMVSLTSTQGETKDSLKTLVEGSTVAWSASAQISAERQKQWSQLKHQEYQRGGSANAAAEAMTTGDFSKFFGKAAPSTMVPIAFTVKTLNGSRKIARIGDLTKYNAPDCQTTGSWEPQTALADGAFTSIGVGLADDVWALSPTQPKTLFKFDKGDNKLKAFNVQLDPQHNSNIKQVSVGRDGTVGMLLEDHSMRVFDQSKGTYRTIDQGMMNTDAGRGDRQVDSIDVFDATHMAVSNHEDYFWTSNGFTTWPPNWVDGGGDTATVQLDQNNRLWSAPNSKGVHIRDLLAGGWNTVYDQAGRVDQIAVGAPNDAWMVHNGNTYKYNKDNASSPWTLVKMGTQMPIIDVGVDGHLWGISADGRVHRWMGLRP